MLHIHCYYMHIYFLQNYGLLKEGKTCYINFSVPEVKILILLSGFIVFGVVLLVDISFFINQANPFLDDLYKYFTCQLGGFDPMCEDIRRQFEKHLHPELYAMTYLLMGLITVVYLLFAIQAQDVKKLIQRIRLCFRAIA